MEKSFVDNLRNAFKGYESAAKSPKMSDLEEEWDKEKARKFGARAAADASYLTSGAVTSAGVSTGHPVAMGIGAGLGALNALAGDYQLTKNETMHTKERKRIFDAMQKEATKQWTKYKNDAIRQSSGGKYTVEKLAKEGKMVDDDGNIVNIDYDYYKTVPYETLNRVFGKAGAEAVRKKMSSEE